MGDEGREGGVEECLRGGVFRCFFIKRQREKKGRV